MRAIEVSADGGTTWIPAGERGSVRIVDTPEGGSLPTKTTTVSLTPDHCVVDEEQLGLSTSTTIQVDHLSEYASRAAFAAVTGKHLFPPLNKE